MSVRTTPMVPWPHMPRSPALLKKITPAAQAGSAGRTSSAPTSTSLPRGSLTTALRNQSWLAARSAAMAATVAPASAGPPSTTTRVGSPSVWLSTKRMGAAEGMAAG